MNSLTPKERFLASPHAAKHQEWCRSETGKAALEAAIVQTTLTINPQNLVLLSGIRDFAVLLLNLSEPELARAPLKSANLVYDEPKPQTQNPKANA